MAIVAVTVVVAAVVFFGYRPLLFTTFDPEVAARVGRAHRRASMPCLMVVLAATILATMQVLGVTLVAASIVIPATVARMLTNSFSTMLLLATGIGAATGFVGMNLSYHLDVQSGPTIVLVGATMFAAVFVLSGGRRLGRIGHS